MAEPDTARRARRVFSQDVLGVGGGLLVLGASSYVFLTLSAHMVAADAFSALSVLYTLVYALGPGIFVPIEQELGRALAHRRERGEGVGPVVGVAFRTSLVGALAVVVAALAGGSALSQRLFNGNGSLDLALAASLAALWLAHLARGATAGLGLFRNYGMQLGTEGLSRMVAVVALAAFGLHAVSGYGWLLPLAILVSVTVTLPHLPKLRTPGPPSDRREVAEALSWLLGGSLLSQVLVNGGPIAAKLLASKADPGAAGSLLAGLVLARIPLFLFLAVQAALLPNLAAQLSRGDHDEFVRGLRALLLALGAITGVAVAVAASVGPPVLRLAFGSRFSLDRLVLVELAASSGMYMLCAAASQSLIALQRYALSAFGWALGAITFVGVIAVPAGLDQRVALAFLLGTAVATATTLSVLIYRRGHTAEVREMPIMVAK
jgi:O-antigen/teichoic acid export membrane protein